MIGLWIAAEAAPAITAQPPRLIDGTMRITFEDYPQEAMRNGEYGVISLHLQVDEAGRVRACAVTDTAKAPTLANASCFLARRARFEPARDASGKAIAGDYRTALVFGLGDHQFLTNIPMTLTVKALPANYAQPAKTQVVFGPDGLVTGCETRASTGSAAADRVICDVIARELKLPPPTRGSKEPAAAVRLYTVTLATTAH